MKSTVELSKKQLLATLHEIDSNAASRERVLRLETKLRTRFKNAVAALPSAEAKFGKFKTNPFVLMLHCVERGYIRISEIEKDIRVAKQFSSMETSAGKAVEAVTLPEYGWTIAESGMQTPDSSLDGFKVTPDSLLVATLKSGPVCLNDEMSENFADAIARHAPKWAKDKGRSRVQYSYGVLYGTPQMSNKKDWHILRILAANIANGSTPNAKVIEDPSGRWTCVVEISGVRIDVAVRVGREWWTHLGGANCLVEVLAASIRAAVAPADVDPRDYKYGIADLGEIVSDAVVPKDFNVALLQKSQLQWLFFLARHYCDKLTN